MVKADLVQRINEKNPKSTKAECREIIDAFFGLMSAHIAQNGPIELRGFGRFTLRRYDNWKAGNLKSEDTTSNHVAISVQFRTSKSLDSALQAAMRASSDG